MSIPKYSQAAEQIKELIISGQLKAGEKLPPERDLCIANDISRITLRAALDLLEKDGYIRREQGRGTFISSESDRKQNGNSGKIVAMVFSSFHERVEESFFTMGVFRALRDIFTDDGTCVCMIQLKKGASFAEHVKESGISEDSYKDGIIFSSYEIQPTDIEMLEQKKIPFCLLGKSSLPSVPQINADHFGEAYGVMKKILELNHRQIAIIDGPEGKAYIDDRIRGYKQALKEAGMSWKDIIFFPTNSWEKELGIEAAGKLLGSGRKFTALISGGDYSSLGVLQVLWRNGLRIPEDSSFVFINLFPEIASCLHQNFTGTLPDMKKLAAEAAEIIRSRAQGKLILNMNRIVPVLHFEGETCKLIK